VRGPGGKSRRLSLSAWLSGRAKLEAHGSGAIVAFIDDYTVELGTFSQAAWSAVRELATGLPLASLAPEGGSTAKEVDVLVRRLGGLGLLEYHAGYSLKSGDDLLVIEPQIAGYWPQVAELDDADWIILSRFAYMHRRETAMVLESPCASALFQIRDPKAASFVAMLSAPQQVGKLRKQEGFPGLEFLGLLAGSQLAFKTQEGARSGQRWAEGGSDLALWDFHDLLFHTRSTEGRHANAVGGTYPHGGMIPQPPAERPSWPGEKIDLCPLLKPGPEAELPIVKLLRERVSIRSFDDRRPVTLAELSQFLDGAARAVMRKLGGKGDTDFPPGLFPPYATGGASYELELYLAVSVCEGLPRGFYHYDFRAHALVPIEVPAQEFKSMLERASYAMGTQAAPQVLVTIAARFGRVSWKYSALAYSLILKDVGILTQNLYLMSTAMDLGGCAIGLVNIDNFERLTGIGFHTEGPVGQFALGRCAPLREPS
jgi:SagB-type dehydrogenase family enzyme